MMEESLKFAIKAHKGQVRKIEKEKPMIIHPINVGNILRKYNFDENVISAGYLHDVVEDTKYTMDDIETRFGCDIKSLVEGATEIDKSLEWEERKRICINKIKHLDLRHKAVVAADKISNLEDMKNLFGKTNERDFNSFNRGFEKQKWFFESVYESLIYNEDLNNPMFMRLKKLINSIFNNIDDYENIKYIFKGKEKELDKLKIINYKLDEVKKLHSVLSNKKPYVIEFTGTPRTGKTTLINNLYDLFKKVGFRTIVLEEFTSSDNYKKNIYPKLKNECKKVINFEIPKYVKKQLEDSKNMGYDIIIIDRSLCDRLIWVDRLYENNEITLDEYNSFIEEYAPYIKENINTIIGTYVDSLTALKRDYTSYLSLKSRSFLNEQNINEYNKSMLNIKKVMSTKKINFKVFDTYRVSQRNISIKVSNKIIDDIRKEYIKQLQEEYN